jgi:ketosteroid isomerase-like protein
MSHENVELARRGLDAHRRRDIQGMCDLSHESCVLFTLTEGVAERQPFRGHIGIADWLARKLEPWETFRMKPTEIREVGERVLVRTELAARGKGSSVNLTADSGLVFEFQDRTIFRVRSYLDWHQALEAVGLRD